MLERKRPMSDNYKNAIRFYNFYNDQWEETTADIKDMRLHGEEENKAELKDLRITGKTKEITLVPLGMKIVRKNRVKMKLEGLYKTIKNLFSSKPLTPKERALKAFLKE